MGEGDASGSIVHCTCLHQVWQLVLALHSSAAASYHLAQHSDHCLHIECLPPVKHTDVACGNVRVIDYRIFSNLIRTLFTISEG